MRRIILAVIGLLAIFTILRAYGEEAKEPRILIHPGLIEFKGEESGARIAFGLLDRWESDGRRIWNIFPMRISIRTGENEFSLGLNGLAFLTRSGIQIGKPIRIDGVKRGDVISIGGPVTVEGTVEGDVWTMGADVILGPEAVVTGSVVALGGVIDADKKSHIEGNKEALPSINIPFIGLLTSDHSAATFLFIIEILGIILYLIVLLLFNLFATSHLAGVNGSLVSYWKGSLLYLILAALLLPLIILLLVASIAGILLIPILFVALILLAYLGHLAVTVRVGSWLRRKEDSSVSFLFTSGLLGLLIIKGPVLVGILFSLLTAELLQGIGRFLIGLGTFLLVLAYLYGLGGMLQYLRTQAKSGT